MPSSVTVVVPTLMDASGLLDDCLDALQRHYPDLPVIVAGRDAPRTFAENANAGAQAATTEAVLFVNDDCLVQPGFLEPMLAALDADHPIVGCKLLYPDGRLQHGGVDFFTTPNGMLHGNHNGDDLPSRDVAAVTAACVLVDREVFISLGMFDELYRNGNEDCDLCLTAQAAGHRVRYVREAVVVHHESASGSARWAHTPENVRRFSERWADRPDCWNPSAGFREFTPPAAPL